MQMFSLDVLQPELPAYCTPTNEFLLRFSSTFHVCVPTPLAFLSNTLGVLSIVSWLFAQLPQIYKNYSIKSTSGLSIFFLIEWCLGDVSNLLGALLTHQASWQVTIGAYYVFVDLCLVGQWIWYEKLCHGRLVRRIYPKGDGPDRDEDGGSMERVVIEGVSPDQGMGNTGTEQNENNIKAGSGPRIIFRNPTFWRDSKEEEKAGSSSSGTPRGNHFLRAGAPSSLPAPSPRTVLMLACLIAVAQASPLVNTPRAHSEHRFFDAQATPLENAGTVLSWMSTFLYLGSRFPQLIKNWSRKSTSGLSPHLFMAAFFGNLFYSSALLTNPCAWSDFDPHGGQGWAGGNGSNQAQWVAAATPFFLGAAGVLGLDASVGVQFLMYGDGDAKVVVIEERQGTQWRWSKIEGWMRGWIPSVNDDGKGGDREALIRGNDRHGDGYGAL